MNRNLKTGDEVYIDGMTSMTQQNSGREKIQDVQQRYDEITGERFPIYLVRSDWFDSRDGSCYSNKNSMYYIEEINNRQGEIETEVPTMSHPTIKKDLLDNLYFE